MPGEKYHYKGVTLARLKIDLQEKLGLPTGIRVGSATHKAAAVRRPTELDKLALWFSKQDAVETAQDYCDKAGADSVVLRANLDGYAVTELQASSYTLVPVKWEHIHYEGRGLKNESIWYELSPFQGKELSTKTAQVMWVRGNDSDSDSDSDSDGF
jgi:hypothetical protein